MGNTYGDYRPYVSNLDPAYNQTLQQMLSGQLSEAQQMQMQRQREQDLKQMSEMYSGRGAPSGAYGYATRDYMTGTGLNAAALAGQQQMAGLQYGLPYMQYGAQQYWQPQQMAQQQYQLQQQYQDQPWYQQALGYVGGLAGDIAMPWAAAKYLGLGARALGQGAGVAGYPQPVGNLPPLPPARGY